MTSSERVRRSVAADWVSACSVCGTNANAFWEIEQQPKQMLSNNKIDFNLIEMINDNSICIFREATIFADVLSIYLLNRFNHTADFSDCEMLAKNVGIVRP